MLAQNSLRRPSPSGKRLLVAVVIAAATIALSELVYLLYSWYSH